MGLLYEEFLVSHLGLMFAYKNFNSKWNKNEKEKKKHQTPLKWKMDFSNFCMDRRWMDELGFYICFNSNSVISGWWKGEHERLCENEALFRFAKNLASSWIPGARDAKLGALTALLWIEECCTDLLLLVTRRKRVLISLIWFPGVHSQRGTQGRSGDCWQTDSGSDP